MSTINEDLLAAAKAVYSQIGNLAPAHVRHVVTPKQRDNLRDAIDAAEHELAERLKPIDDAFLIADCGGSYRYDSEDELEDDSFIGWSTSKGIEIGPSVAIYVDDGQVFLDGTGVPGLYIKNRGQLLDLLSGLGIEVNDG